MRSRLERPVFPGFRETFSLPWEEDLLSGSGAVVIVEASASKASLANDVRSSSQAPSLIHRGSFGLRTVSSSPSGVKEVSLSYKGKDPLPKNGLLRQGFLGSNSTSSSLLEKLSK
jgi:hypothetical protein